MSVGRLSRMAFGKIRGASAGRIGKGSSSMPTTASAYCLDAPRSHLASTALDQIAEGEMVVTRKVLHGTHHGTFQGIEPTGRWIEINLIDIVRVSNGRIVEHW